MKLRAKPVVAALASTLALLLVPLATPAPAHAYEQVGNNPPPPHSANERIKIRPHWFSITFQLNKNETRVLARNGGLITAIGLTPSVLGPEIGIPTGAAAAMIAQEAANAQSDNKCVQLKLYYVNGSPDLSEYRGGYCK